MGFRNFRGSGIKYTASFIGRFSGIWLLVTIASVLVASTAVFLAFATISGGPGSIGRGILITLIVQTILVILAVVVLAVFTTHRLAGPWVAIRRACQRARDGDLDTPLEIRGGDAHLRAVENDFNAMLDVIRQRVGRAPAEAGSSRSPSTSEGG